MREEEEEECFKDSIGVTRGVDWGNSDEVVDAGGVPKAQADTDNEDHLVMCETSVFLVSWIDGVAA